MTVAIYYIGLYLFLALLASPFIRNINKINSFFDKDYFEAVYKTVGVFFFGSAVGIPIDFIDKNRDVQLEYFLIFYIFHVLFVFLSYHYVKKKLFCFVSKKFILFIKWIVWIAILFPIIYYYDV